MAKVLLMAKNHKNHNIDDQENCPPSPPAKTSLQMIQLPTCSTSTSLGVSMSPPPMTTNVAAQQQLSMDMKFFQNYLLREQHLRAAESNWLSDMQAQLIKMMNTVINRLLPPQEWNQHQWFTNTVLSRTDVCYLIVKISIFLIVKIENAFWLEL